MAPSTPVADCSGAIIAARASAAESAVGGR
jgi:hypothetical protein